MPRSPLRNMPCAPGPSPPSLVPDFRPPGLSEEVCRLKTLSTGRMQRVHLFPRSWVCRGSG